MDSQQNIFPIPAHLHRCLYAEPRNLDYRVLCEWLRALYAGAEIFDSDNSNTIAFKAETRFVTYVLQRTDTYSYNSLI
jgi:hypothetical protein